MLCKAYKFYKEVPVHIQTDKKLKNIIASVYSFCPLAFVLKLPAALVKSNEDAEKFYNKYNYIFEECYNKIMPTYVAPSEGTHIKIWGEDFQIEKSFVDGSNLSIKSVDLDNKVIKVNYLNAFEHKSSYAYEEVISDLFISYLKRLGMVKVLGLQQKYKNLTNVAPEIVDVCEISSKFGDAKFSVNKLNNETCFEKIRLNVMLVQAAPEAMENVYVHELAHYFYYNHNSKFEEKIKEILKLGNCEYLLTSSFRMYPSIQFIKKIKSYNLY
jgi:predicted metal-dependent hydrolase